ncbi:DUF2066 domain-containing protein [Alteromonas sp. CYL-A6]|uniref:DUF2066 domain-containing protein n=1 Tax=Alteromonas nitratireducens TaxID=3390813 RepID=UPI0034A85B35
MLGLYCFRLCRAAVIACGLAVSAAGHAAQQVDVSEVRVAVKDQSQSVQRTALRTAMGQALVKMSGDPAILSLPSLKAALRDADSYLRSYRYQDTARGMTLIARFNEERLLSLLRDAALPVWGSRRPQSIVWMAVEDDDLQRRVIDDADTSPLTDALKFAAQARGVPVSFPLMDLTDSQAISLYEIWGRFSASLKEASLRYATDNIIGARLYHNHQTAVPDLPSQRALTDLITSMANASGEGTQPAFFGAGVDGAVIYVPEDTSSVLTESQPDPQQGDSMADTLQPEASTVLATAPAMTASREDGPRVANALLPFSVEEFEQLAERADKGAYALDWLLIVDGTQRSGSLYGDDPEQLIASLVGKYATYLASQYAIQPSDATQALTDVVISVANMTSLTAYARARDYLQSLSVVDKVSLVAQDGSVGSFSLSLIGSADDFMSIIRLEPRLTPVTDAFGQPLPGFNFYWNE